MHKPGHSNSNNNDHHRQRLIAALNHQQAGRIPLTLGSPSCSIHRTAHQNLQNFLGLKPKEPAVIIDNILQIVEPDQQIIERFDIDALWILPHENPVEWSEDGQSYQDEFGRRFISGGGFFNQTGQPLLSDTLEELTAYHFPDLSQGSRFQGLGAKAKHYSEHGYGLGLDGPWGVYEISSSLRGTAAYLMDLASNPNYAFKLAERVLEEHHIPFYTRLLEDTAPYIQLVGISDDLGSQQGLIFSPKTFRQIFKPLLRRLVDHIHSLADVKVYMHSDGSIYPIIPDLIEIGVEGLNPVQYTAKGMELERLKTEFGKDLGFFGGVVENQVLSFNTPEQIRQLVRQNISILAPEGGFLFAPIHNISPEVPPENIIALYDAGIEFGKY